MEMARYLLKRSLQLVLAVFIASTVVFFLLRLLPGDAVSSIVGIDATPEQIEAARRELGLDRHPIVQYTDWISGVLTGDFGNSYLSKLPVLPEVIRRLPVTLPLSLAAFALATVVAVPLGVMAAVRRRRASGLVISAGINVGVATPVFWVGILLIWLFALALGWLPAGGFPRRGWADPVTATRSLILPVLTVAFAMTVVLVRYVRSAILDVLGQDYLRTSVALGYTPAQARRRHAIRNAAVPVIAIMAIELATSLLGAVVVENVFALPGLGSQLLEAVRTRDLPTVQGIVFLIMVFVLAIGFIADVVQRLVDPRLVSQAAERAGV